MSDLGALGISLGYVIATLAIAETLRKRYGLPGEFTRKFVHIAIGTWIVPTFHLFESLWWAIALPAVFIGINALSYQLKFFSAIEQEDGHNLGTILMPVSFVVLLLVFWQNPQREAAMLGLMCLAWGDAFAAIIGRTYGRLKFRILGEERSLEGSFAMYLFSFVACAAVLALERPGMDLMDRALVATGVAVGATLIEAVSVRGTDNLLVPLGGAALGWMLLRGVGG